YLEENGVSCKFDRQERLLHSKYLIIDNSLLIIGSHNWSAGSFFQFDDLSLAVRSTDLVAQQLSRFNALWDAN
ncbi:MAG TPA: phospholipase D-like domain-containing protein, partial [Pyrinomonadaceae bacterium]|nr:phospholipase D-like domain-containing protein [Pyrinomonadaceae bacterium]